MIIKDLVLKVGYTTAVLEEPLSIYIYDRDIMLNIKVIDYDFKFGGSYENFIGSNGIVKAITYLRSPKGEIFTDIETAIEDDVIKVFLTEDMTNELTEIGNYTIQIKVFDDNGSSIHIHPFKFEVCDLIARTGNLGFDAGDDNFIYYPEDYVSNIITSNYLNELEYKLSLLYSNQENGLFKSLEIDEYSTESKTTEGAINELKKLLNDLILTFSKLKDGTLNIGKYKAENNLDSNTPRITGISVLNKENPNHNFIKIGSYYVYRCSTIPEISNKTSAVRWISSDPSVARVNSTGKVIGVNRGYAMIKVYSIYDASLYDEFRVDII